MVKVLMWKGQTVWDHDCCPSCYCTNKTRFYFKAYYFNYWQQPHIFNSTYCILGLMILFFFFWPDLSLFLFYCLNNIFLLIFFFFLDIVPLMQKGECNLKKPYHSVLNMSSLSVLMLPYHVYLLYLITRPWATAALPVVFNEARCECLDAFM